MIKLLKIDFKKIRGSKVFWILTGLYALLIILFFFGIQGFLDDLAEEARGYDCSVEVVPVVKDALSRGLSLMGEKSILLIAGSVFVAASARIAWFERI